MRRPTHLWVNEASVTRLAERTVYGESLSAEDAEDGNLRGQVYRVYDGAGVHTLASFDFKGNLLQHSRRLLDEVDGEVDWSDIATSNDADDIEILQHISSTDNVPEPASCFNSHGLYASTTSASTCTLPYFYSALLIAYLHPYSSDHHSNARLQILAKSHSAHYRSPNVATKGWWKWRQRKTRVNSYRQRQPTAYPARHRRMIPFSTKPWGS
jgi:hypothetical protein